MMDGIRLSRNDKKVLRLVADGHTGCPAYIPSDKYAAAAWTLERLGLVSVAREKGGGIVDVRLTERGKCRIAANPRLCTPLDWKWIASTAIALIAAIAAVAALFVSCWII